VMSNDTSAVTPVYWYRHHYYYRHHRRHCWRGRYHWHCY
jgi:hypothetical protein